MKTKHIILIHIFFWMLAGSLNFAFLVFREGVPAPYYLRMCIKTGIEAVDFYIVYLLLIPRFFDRKRLLLFFAVALIYLIIFVPVYLTSTNFAPVIKMLKEGEFPSKIMFISASYYAVLYAFLGGLFRLAVDGIRSNQQRVLLEKQNTKNELAFLRSQINPHFLFNMLNTIHSYINSNNPNAAKAVIRLSDIMRFMLTDATHELIALEQEVEYLNSYIELQNYRMEKPQFVQFSISGEIKGILIPPLLLIPFVENAFKHGKKEGSNTGISISLVIDRNQLDFKIINTIQQGKTSLTEEVEGLGQSNVTRRLELLYPNLHTLKIYTSDQQYIVDLHLDLKV